MNVTADTPPATPTATATSDDEFLVLRQRIKGSNIDETTLLATDYLNH
ncbi:MAG: hypothetical protein IIA35_04595, partial [Proteobacteria bacterium]|nr:hypothetical protein [Pseudomonadota bacterium]